MYGDCLDHGQAIYKNNAQEIPRHSRMLFTGPDYIREHRVTVEPEHRAVGVGTMSQESTSEVDYLWRASPRIPFPRPKSSRVGEIGWGLQTFTDWSMPVTGRQMMMGEFRQELEDKQSHKYQNPWYPGPNDHMEGRVNKSESRISHETSVEDQRLSSPDVRDSTTAVEQESMQIEVETPSEVIPNAPSHESQPRRESTFIPLSKAKQLRRSKKRQTAKKVGRPVPPTSENPAVISDEPPAAPSDTNNEQSQPRRESTLIPLTKAKQLRHSKNRSK